MISLFVFLSLTISKNRHLKNIKINSIPGDSCANAPSKDLVGCQQAYDDLVALLAQTEKSKLPKDSTDHQYQKLKRKALATPEQLLNGITEFESKCISTKCRVDDTVGDCASVIAGGFTLNDIRDELTDFGAKCNPGNGEELPLPTATPLPTPLPGADETSEENDGNNETSTPGQAPGRGYQRWNSKEIKLLMILTNLIGLLYFIR
jgi:hypothetical protein